MAAKKRRRRSGKNWLVALLVSLVVSYCVLSSLQQKHGLALGLPEFAPPSLSKLYEAIGDFVDAPDPPAPKDNALAVSGTPESPGLFVDFLDVGQAKCILIRAPAANVLIDAGENNQGGQVLRYLQDKGVKKLDIAIGTHPHSDHIGGLDTVIGGIPVDTVILPELPDELVATTQTYTDLLLAIEEKGLFITPAVPGDTFDLGDGAALTILAPLTEYADLNNMSVVARLSYGQTSFLFTGDASAQSELSLIGSDMNLRADVLDVGHHGSNTATTDAFLRKVSPQIAVFSCGLGNSYGHPHREVVERLQKYNVKILRTDLHGAVVITSDGKSLGILTEKGEVK